MRVHWTLPAAADLEHIHQYLSLHLPSLASSTTRRIFESAMSLNVAPNRGRPGRRIGTRELVLAPLPYLVVYRVGTNAVEILHIHHGSQDWKV